ncbi:IS1 family transposase/transposase-like protein [Epilithonimonas hungarica]|uniref:IS1 family transposase n=1 Tax=Epilithonimonas hungarica TaxID=454006 RepID=UPI0027871C16|nr:IS1 family transposase [Epilithonimonas hungarica]MDP9955123.1 IS1 family transposase/transposase-like protein [Epilithonimonas hungarica]
MIEIENYRQENCLQCERKGVKYGKSSKGIQRLHCKSCHKTWQISYVYKAYSPKVNGFIIRFIKEGCGIRGIAGLLRISTTTLLNRIRSIAQKIQQPILTSNKIYEVDELCTYVGRRENRIWIACALERESKKVVRFYVGKRTNKTIRKVIDDLLISNPRQIITDKLVNYQYLILKEIHRTFSKGIQNLERMNLNLRTHLKRLNKRTIAFSKEITILKAVTRIYLWA